MKTDEPLVFKFASEDWEFEAIHQLNYRTFVEEIPQHKASPTHRLVDQFHAENTYLICLSGRKLVGMLAARGARPFSLDKKLENVDSYLPPGRKVCEIRLLAVDPKFRGAQVLQGIIALLWQHGVEQGYGLAIISGTTRQFRLYKHLGFVPFGPLVGAGEARFQPMYVTLETFETTAREFLRSSPSRAFQPSAANFLPGPVAVRREVRRAFEQAPESHRGEGFVKDFEATREMLAQLTGAKRVSLFFGSGTLANDVVAGQLSLEGSRGLVLSNGEFGERLADQARRAGLAFDHFEFGWGQPFDLEAVRRALAADPAPRWLWCTHCETSAGVLNDLEQLKRLCNTAGVKLCVDAISSIGNLPVNLAGVFLATGSSGKGLRAYPGVAMVFHHHDPAPAESRLPRYLDLGWASRQVGPAFTFSSNLLHALHAALQRVPWEQRFSGLAELAEGLRARLRESGFELVGDSATPSPAVITIALPEGLNSNVIGGMMRESGYLLSYQSDYLKGKNWIQISLMGEGTREKSAPLVNHLTRACFHRPPGRAVPAQAQ